MRSSSNLGLGGTAPLLMNKKRFSAPAKLADSNDYLNSSAHSNISSLGSIGSSQQINDSSNEVNISSSSTKSVTIQDDVNSAPPASSPPNAPVYDTDGMDSGQVTQSSNNTSVAINSNIRETIKELPSSSTENFAGIMESQSSSESTSTSLADQLAKAKLKKSAMPIEEPKKPVETPLDLPPTVKEESIVNSSDNTSNSLADQPAKAKLKKSNTPAPAEIAKKSEEIPQNPVVSIENEEESMASSGNGIGSFAEQLAKAKLKKTATTAETLQKTEEVSSNFVGGETLGGATVQSISTSENTSESLMDQIVKAKLKKTSSPQTSINVTPVKAIESASTSGDASESLMDQIVKAKLKKRPTEDATAASISVKATESVDQTKENKEARINKPDAPVKEGNSVDVKKTNGDDGNINEQIKNFKLKKTTPVPPKGADGSLKNAAESSFITNAKKEEMEKEEIKKEEDQKEDGKKEDIKKEEIKAKEIKIEEIRKEENKTQEIKTEEDKKEEIELEKTSSQNDDTITTVETNDMETSIPENEILTETTPRSSSVSKPKASNTAPNVKAKDLMKVKLKNKDIIETPAQALNNIKMKARKNSDEPEGKKKL